MKRIEQKPLLFFCSALLIFLAVFFVAKNAKARIVINEIMTGNKDSLKNEFIELYNTDSSNPIVLDKYKLTKKTANGSESNLVSSAKFSGTIPAGGYFVIAHPEYEEVIGADIAYSGTSYSISDNNTILLYDSSGSIADLVGHGAVSVFETAAAENPGKGKSIGRIDGKDSNDNSKDFFILKSASPGKENEKLKEESSLDPNIYSDKIQITELLPNPNNGESEYIELYNGSDEKVCLSGWSLHDASKVGEYIFSSDDSIESEKYFVIYKDKYKFALNDSGFEKLTLYDPNKKEIFNVSYDGSKNGASYNFDGKNWRWSKFQTPNKENIFEKIPVGDLNIDDDVYVNVYADFEILGLGKNAKVSWDFGDGHKSSLQKTKHKYAEIGKYEGSVKFSEGSEDVARDFTIKVSGVPHPEVKIIAVNANPKGSDTENETIKIKNKSRKKINLKNWSIATGWKKLYNHPVSDDFEIKAGKEKEITREFSKFTLNNKKSKIELRYPDGKVAYSIKYKNEKGIIEDEIYEKKQGGWTWHASAKQEAITKKQTSNAAQDTNKQYANGDQDVDRKNKIEDILDEDVGKQTFGKKEILLLKTKSALELENVELEPYILGAETVREIDSLYHFTPESYKQEHYAIVFLKSISSDFNKWLNMFLNYFVD